MWRPITIMTLAVSPLITSCGALSGAPDGLSQDWRKARVVEVGPSSAVLPRAHVDCRRSHRPVNGQHRFAAVVYRLYPSNSKLKWMRIVPVEPGAHVRVGQWVYVDVSDCSRALVPARAGAPGSQG